MSSMIELPSVLMPPTPLSQLQSQLTDRDEEEKSSVDERLEPPVIVSHDMNNRDVGVDIVTLKNVHKTYLLGVEGVPALRGVTVNIKKGEFVVILGTSGGGKTTMLNVIGTIDKPTKGEVTICGIRINSNTPDDKLAALRLDRLAFVFQTFNLLQSMTALENVMLPMILQGQRSRESIKQRATDLLRKVGLGDRLGHLPNQLSGGEQQRVTIARALSNNPDVLLLDEPTGDLDTANTELVLQLLVELNMKEGITMIMVTHDTGLKNFAHRVIRMVDGKINRIDSIPEESRRNKYMELLAMIEQQGKRGSTAVREGATVSEPSPEEDVDKRSSSSGSGAGSTVRTQTEFRHPSNYPTHMKHTSMWRKGMLKEHTAPSTPEKQISA
eukprot:GILJ01006900.1.p1 GENE.GILJ01006900.1~~GILJ01006900.1.p1  ORF type:complete len:384 (-),score=56.67 GILJ01006900.1:303-1454(-)